jgi:hypothetical protein
VLLDRLLAEEELRGDLLVGLALGDKLGHPALAAAEGSNSLADLLAPALRARGCLAEGAQLARGGVAIAPTPLTPVTLAPDNKAECAALRAKLKKAKSKRKKRKIRSQLKKLGC